MRWPGHSDAVDTLKSCGLLDLDPVSVKGVEVAPRDVLLAAIEPRLRAQPGDTDVCVMHNTVTGLQRGVRVRITYSMWDEADTAAGISGMGRVTGFPAAIAAVMIGRGLIAERGLVPPEDAIHGDGYRWFLGELEKHGIRIAEVVEPVSVTAVDSEAAILH